MVGCRAVYGAGGLLAGSWSCASVLSVPGAGGVAVRACLAAESSPWCTRCLARSALRSGVGVLVVVAWLASAMSLWCNRWCQSPCWNAWSLLRHSSLGRVRVPGVRCRSIRGNSNQSVHARVDSTSVRAWVICSKLKCNAARIRPLMKCGGVANISVRARSLWSKSMLSRVRNARFRAAWLCASLALLVLCCV